MIPIPKTSLWLGHAGDLREPREVFSCGIEAILDLATEEPFPSLPRQTIYCRFPLIDGAGNAPEFLSLILSTGQALLAQSYPTLICCSMGLSRSPAIAAAILSQEKDADLHEMLKWIGSLKPIDVSPLLWNDLCETLQ